MSMTTMSMTTMSMTTIVLAVCACVVLVVLLWQQVSQRPAVVCEEFHQFSADNNFVLEMTNELRGTDKPQPQPQSRSAQAQAQAQDVGGGGVGGGGVGGGDVGVRAQLRAQLTAFFEQYEEKKLPYVDELMAEFAGKEQELLAELAEAREKMEAKAKAGAPPNGRTATRSPSRRSPTM